MGIKSSKAINCLGVRGGKSIVTMGVKTSPVSMVISSTKTEDHTNGIHNEMDSVHRQREVIKGMHCVPKKQFYGLEKKPKSKKTRDDLNYC